MDVLAVVFLIILVFVILSFRVSVTKHFDRLEREIKRLQDQLAKATAVRAQRETPPAAATSPVQPVKEERMEEDYSESPVGTPEQPATLPEAAKEPQPIPQQWVQKGPVSIPAKPATPPPPRPAPAPKPSFFERHPDLEKFIGENLVNKIGIAILVLAIGFFVKYAIDKEWIGPIGRVSIGILAGGILIGLAHRLHKNYKGFSSVLVGGGLAIFYFTITLAYHQFHLFSQPVSFTIMVVITAFAVALSLLYDRQELAIIALVGGFMAPFLVSDGSGNYKALFTYLLILNTGLLIMAYNKAWRLLNLLSFIFTAILVTSWAFGSADNRFDTWRNGFLFATAFYLLFFIINIANNIKENKQFLASDFGILLANTALYFGLGLYFINSMDADNYRGLFTASMGVFNLGASFLLFRRQRVDRNVLYLLTGITLTFISLTAPIQLHGNYITLFWASESVLLYWLYRRSKLAIVQVSSVIIWFAMLVSLLMDWVNIYGDVSAQLLIIINKGFITTIYSAVATYLLFVLRGKGTGPEHMLQGFLPRGTLFRVTGIILLFIAGALEINHQFQYYYPGVALNLQYLLLYAFVFMLLFVIIQTKWEPAPSSPGLRLWLLSISLLIYLLTIAATGSLLQHLLDQGKYLAHFASHWIAALLAGILFYYTVDRVRKHFPGAKDQGLVCWLLCTWVVFFVSAEAGFLVSRLYYTDRASWLTIQDIFIKTGLPILWGLCSFAFMWLGMRHKFRPLRIVSLTLFSITLVKLFVYDIRNIPAGGKIAAFFCLGVLLLVVSFMYQRLKRIIIEDEKKRLNKLYTLAAGLVLFAQTHAQTGFRFASPLDTVVQSGFYSIGLGPALTACLQPGLPDIRIVDAAGKQAPYILKNEVPPSSTFSVNKLPIVSNKKEADGLTHVVIENTLARPLGELLLTIKNTDARRTVTLSGSDNDSNWYVIKENIPLNTSFTGADGSYAQSLDFPLSQYHYFKISINGKDLLPVNIIQAGTLEQSFTSSKYIPLPAPQLLNKDSGDKYSYVFLRFKDFYFIDRLMLMADGARFYNRKMFIYTGSIGSAQLVGEYSLRSDLPAVFETSVKTDHLLLKIQNDDNPPLKVISVTAFQLNKYLLTWLEKGKSYRLLFGDSSASAPVYDLQYFKDSIGSAVMPLAYGKPERNQQEAPAPAPPANRWLIWVALGAACIVLLLLTAKMLGAINKRNT